MMKSSPTLKEAYWEITFFIFNDGGKNVGGLIIRACV